MSPTIMRGRGHSLSSDNPRIRRFPRSLPRLDLPQGELSGLDAHFLQTLWQEDQIMNRSLTFACVVVTGVSGAAVAQQRIPVSGSFNYTPEVFARVSGGESVFVDASEDEIWTGDIEGTAVSPFRLVITPDGAFDAWLHAEFEGTILDEYEGTLIILSRYERPAAGAHWTGDWIILSGTGELENVQGNGTAWGPGVNAEDPEAGPDIFYSGQVVRPAK
jgi:hypothetical protein